MVGGVGRLEGQQAGDGAVQRVGAGEMVQCMEEEGDGGTDALTLAKGLDYYGDFLGFHFVTRPRHQSALLAGDQKVTHTPQ